MEHTEKKKRDKVTIKDVAREAGVSISTVSNALNDVDVLAPDTKAHVLEVVERMHYIPNLTGRNLKLKETKVIGLFVTSLKGTYFGTLADSLFEAAMKRGYELNIFATWNTKSSVNNILGHNMDGAVILESEIDDKELQRIIDYDVAAIFLDREVGENRIGSVVFDSYQDGVNAAEYLISKGAKSFAHIMGIRENYDGIGRYQGFADTLKKHGFSLEPDYVLEGMFSREKAKESMEEFLKKGLPLPEAIFASNDISAIGCMEALQEAGIKVPQDVMIMGVDDIELGEWYRPTLTTINTGFEQQGEIAIEQLLRILDDEEGQVVKLRGKIIERESTRRS